MRDVFRPWPGALRDSNYRADRRTSCARSINMQPTPLGGRDSSTTGGRRRQFFLAPTPGIQTSASGRNLIPKYPPRGLLSTPTDPESPTVYIVAGGRSSSPALDRGERPGAAEPGTLYRGVDRTVAVGDLGGAVTTNANSRAWPPLCQLAWGGPQVGILMVAGNGKIGIYDERTSTWFPDLFGPNISIDAIGVQFFQNYFFVLSSDNTLYAGPLLGRNADPDSTTGAFLSTDRAMIDHDNDSATADVPGQYARYAFDLTQLVQRSLEPDPWVTMLALSDRLLLFGRNTMGTMQLKANPGTGFPLEPVLGEQFQVGALAQGAVASVGDRAYWVGRSPDAQTRAWRFGGEGGVEPISTPAVDEYLANLTALAQERARCTASAIAGRQCFAMRFGERFDPDGTPSPRYNRLDATWCYDETTQMWHERGRWVPDRDGPNRGGWIQWEVVFAQAHGRVVYVVAEDHYLDRTVVGFLTVDRSGTHLRPDGVRVPGNDAHGNFWADAILTGRTPGGTLPTRAPNLISPTTSGIIRRERITPHWGTRATRHSIRGVKVSMGLGGGDVLLSVSKDGGQTYSLEDLRQTPSLGADELRWFALGDARDPVLRITMLGKSAALNNVWANMLRTRG